jgi:hypothetical protein
VGKEGKKVMTIPDAADRIADIKKLGKHFRGRRELIAHYQGKTLTRAQAMLGVCYDCLGYFSDGANDCEQPSCPLYPWMPYRKEKPAKKGRSEAQTRADGQRALILKEKRASGKLNKESGDKVDGHSAGERDPLHEVCKR